MLFASGRNNGRLAATSASQRSQRLEHSIYNPQPGALKPDFGQAADIAEAAMSSLSVLGQFNLDRDAARGRMRNLSGK